MFPKHKTMGSSPVKPILKVAFKWTKNIEFVLKARMFYKLTSIYKHNSKTQIVKKFIYG